MLQVGQEEIDAIARVLNGDEPLHYRSQGECGRFEGRFASFLGVRQVALCASGTAALSAALAGLGIGPGDEVLIPAHTYISTSFAVLAVGAIPVIVEVDESTTLDPEAAREAIGPRTRAMIPVHMWGNLCDLDTLLDIAERRGVMLIEDACQCIGGSYRGRAAGSLGHAGAVSFNHYKNMTCGEGGAVFANDDLVIRRARCMIDPNSVEAGSGFTPFVNGGSRVSELAGAMLNVQLDRLPGLIDRLRTIKARIVAETAGAGLTPTPRHSPEGECATTVMYLLPTAAAARDFAGAVRGTVLIDTGRHVYTEWSPILGRQGAHHPALNPFTLPENAGCRMDYRPDLCPRTLDILSRTVSIELSPGLDEDAVAALVARIVTAATAVPG